MEDGVTLAKVYIPRGRFLLLLRDSIVPHETRENNQSGQPRNRELIESIASIRLAAVRDFWQDNAPFPGNTENLWWEVWLRLSEPDTAEQVLLPALRDSLVHADCESSQTST